MSGFTFENLDLSSVQEDIRPSRLMSGNHHVKITEASLENYKSSSGANAARVNVTFHTPDERGVISERYNVFNPSEKATEIGRSQLKSLLLAAKHPSPDMPKDVSTMIGLELMVGVGLGKPFTGNDGMQKQLTEVKRYMPLENGAASGSGTSDPTDNGGDEIPF